MSNLETDRFWIGFDLGGTKMLSAVFDEDLKLLGRRRRKTKGSEGATAGVTRIIETIERNLAELSLDPKRMAGIGIGCPGPIDMTTGEILLAPNLGWKELRIGPALSKHFDCPVSVLNDVDAGVYAEYRFGAAKNGRCVVGIFPGTGVGGGCVYQGQIFQGGSISCMEIGHTRIATGDRASAYGMTGTLEAEASRLAIAAEVAKAAYRGEAPFVAKEAGTDIASIRSNVLALGCEKDDAVREIVNRAIEVIGLAASNVVHLLAPDFIVLGGGLVEAMPDMFVNGVAKVLKKSILPPYKNRFTVVPAKLGDDAGVMGAAAWAQYQFRTQMQTMVAD